MEEKPLEKPVPWDFVDHRAFLKAWMDYMSATRRGFSLRQFSRRAGFASPNYLRLVADGERNLSARSMGRFARALGLNAREREAFEALVYLGQAKDDAERNIYYERLRRRAGAGASTAREIERAQYEIYSRWYVLPIREMLSLPDFREDARWIASRLRPKIRPAEAERALEILLDAGVAVRDADGRLKPADIKLKTAATVQSLAIRNYHRSMLELTERALDHVPRDERNVTSLTISLNRKQYDLICARIEEFRLSMLDLIEDEPMDEDDDDPEIHVLGFQVVPLTRKSEDHE
ncbi:MAG: TIGR02147 family protein [Myxococcota bacterium]